MQQILQLFIKIRKNYQ